MSRGTGTCGSGPAAIMVNFIVDKTKQNRYSVYMVRTREFDPTTALTSAMQVFAARGYSNTSIDDVVSATGVSRYSLYGTFGNKRELFEQALEKYTEHMGKATFMKMLEPDSSVEQIRATFDERIAHMFENEEKNGCLVVHTAMELAPRDKDIEIVLNRLLKRMSNAYCVCLEHSRERGEVKEGLDPKQAGQFLTGAFFGLSVMARCGFSRELLNDYVDSTIAAVAR